ncbi:MAG: hypothetical protein HQK88_03715 [Nitrospirae bacterium]|nr:hypothetical protein [Nitrospirota bacterium]MBF0533565.1 hypothetical protein [Nitrospirota bacterium]MBF0615910.1 hypothetical protein [Nitrospirota bacterium]
MIRIKKQQTPPKILATKGVEKTQELCNEFNENKEYYISGVQTFKFQRELYGDEEVKKTLIEAQHGKCCFCESDVTHISHGHVEHFRPKGGFKQDIDSVLRRPGYYWLAYDWSNLFFSCEKCNQSKANRFPLENPNNRALTHDDKIEDEKPLLINPAADDPE